MFQVNHDLETASHGVAHLQSVSHSVWKSVSVFVCHSVCQFVCQNVCLSGSLFDRMTVCQ